jgi:hypothetical protein
MSISINTESNETTERGFTRYTFDIVRTVKGKAQSYAAKAEVTKDGQVMRFEVRRAGSRNASPTSSKPYIEIVAAIRDYITTASASCCVKEKRCPDCNGKVLNADEAAKLEQWIDADQSFDAGEFSGGHDYYADICGCAPPEPTEPEPEDAARTVTLPNADDAAVVSDAEARDAVDELRALEGETSEVECVVPGSGFEDDIEQLVNHGQHVCEACRSFGGNSHKRGNGADLTPATANRFAHLDLTPEEQAQAEQGYKTPVLKALAKKHGLKVETVRADCPPECRDCLLGVLPHDANQCASCPTSEVVAKRQARNKAKARRRSLRARS